MTRQYDPDEAERRLPHSHYFVPDRQPVHCKKVGQKRRICAFTWRGSMPVTVHKTSTSAMISGVFPKDVFRQAPLMMVFSYINPAGPGVVKWYRPEIQDQQCTF
jgi:hypothetical protein